jgi:hypothetical protein
VIPRRLPWASTAALAVAAEFPAPANDLTERKTPLPAFYLAEDHRRHFMPTRLKKQHSGLLKPK